MYNANNTQDQAVISNNYFTFNHIKKKIVGSEHHFKLAGKANTPQYVELMALMAEKPDYQLKAIPSKKKAKKKQTYAGMNMELIKQFVDALPDQAMKDQLANLIEDKRSYPTIKSWLLENFKGITVDQMEKFIKETKLAEAKRTALRVRPTKRENAVTDTPIQKRA